MKYQSLVLIMALAISLSCSNSIEAEQDNDARIKWASSIDEIAIGDHVSKVLETLGEPDEIGLGDFNGDFYYYHSGKHNGLTVAIDNIPNHEENVLKIHIKHPYGGVTEDSLGIGSNRESIQLSVGPSDTSWARTDVWYYSNSKWLVISDDENKVTDIDLIDINYTR